MQSNDIHRRALKTKLHIRAKRGQKKLSFCQIPTCDAITRCTHLKIVNSYISFVFVFNIFIFLLYGTKIPILVLNTEVHDES